MITRLEEIVNNIVEVHGLEDPLTLIAFAILASAKRGELEAGKAKQALFALNLSRHFAILDSLDDEDDAPTEEEMNAPEEAILFTAP